MLHSLLLLTAGFKSETPHIVQRKPMPYIAIRSSETMTSIGSAFSTQIPKLFAWAGTHRAAIAGPLFMRFMHVDMEKELDIEIGFPVAKEVKGDARIDAGVLPGGTYVSLTHFGDYSGLVAPNQALQNWAKAKHLKPKMVNGKKGLEFASRLEIYKSDPNKQSDHSKWETEIVYLVEK